MSEQEQDQLIIAVVKESRQVREQVNMLREKGRRLSSDLQVALERLRQVGCAVSTTPPGGISAIERLVALQRLPSGIEIAALADELQEAMRLDADLTERKKQLGII